MIPVLFWRGDFLFYQIQKTEMSEVTETINELLQSLGLDTAYRTESLTLLENGESRYIRDFKLNFTSTLTSEHLTAKECALMGLTIAINNNNKPLTQYYTRYAEANEATPADIAETAADSSPDEAVQQDDGQQDER